MPGIHRAPAKKPSIKRQRIPSRRDYERVESRRQTVNPLLLVFALNGCAPTAKSEGTGGYIDDTVITAKVKSELVRDDRLKAR